MSSSARDVHVNQDGRFTVIVVDSENTVIQNSSTERTAKVKEQLPGRAKGRGYGFVGRPRPSTRTTSPKPGASRRSSEETSTVTIGRGLLKYQVLQRREAEARMRFLDTIELKMETPQEKFSREVRESCVNAMKNETPTAKTFSELLAMRGAPIEISTTSPYFRNPENTRTMRSVGTEVPCYWTSEPWDLKASAQRTVCDAGVQVDRADWDGSENREFRNTSLVGYFPIGNDHPPAHVSSYFTHHRMLTPEDLNRCCSVNSPQELDRVITELSSRYVGKERDSLRYVFLQVVRRFAPRRDLQQELLRRSETNWVKRPGPSFQLGLENLKL